MLPWLQDRVRQGGAGLHVAPIGPAERLLVSVFPAENGLAIYLQDELVAESEPDLGDVLRRCKKMRTRPTFWTYSRPSSNQNL